jgi:hypothetical protein
MNIKLNKNLELHNSLSLVFHHSKISYLQTQNGVNITPYNLTGSNINYSENQNEVSFNPYDITVEFSPELKINLLPKNRNNPYLLFGPNIRTYIWKEKPSPLTRDIDLALNFGFGFDNKTEFFTFAPELKYTYGVMKSFKNPPSNVVINPQLHTLSLILHFRD